MKKRKVLAIPPREAHYSGKRIRRDARLLKERNEREAARVAAENAASAEGMQHGTV
jgi:hypothetical protein